MIRNNNDNNDNDDDDDDDDDDYYYSYLTPLVVSVVTYPWVIKLFPMAI